MSDDSDSWYVGEERDNLKKKVTKLERELARFKTASMCELAGENTNLRHYMEHLKSKWGLETKKTWRKLHKDHACMYVIEWSSSIPQDYHVYRYVVSKGHVLVAICNKLTVAQIAADEDFEKWLAGE